MLQPAMRWRGTRRAGGADRGGADEKAAAGTAQGRYLRFTREEDTALSSQGRGRVHVPLAWFEKRRRAPPFEIRALGSPRTPPSSACQTRLPACLLVRSADARGGAGAGQWGWPSEARTRISSTACRPAVPCSGKRIKQEIQRSEKGPFSTSVLANSKQTNKNAVSSFT